MSASDNECFHSEKKRSPNVVASRRGRWVVKLALALFLSRQGITEAGELSRIHSELWRHDFLGEESLVRGYAPPGTDLFAAESIWKQLLGRMWLKSGFDACEAALEPYFKKKYNEYRQHEAQERQLRDANECAEPVHDPVELSDTTEANAAGAGPAPMPAASASIDKPLLEQLTKLYQNAVQYARQVQFAASQCSQGWIPAEELFAHLQGDKCDCLHDDGVAHAEAVQLPTTPWQLIASLRSLDLLGRLQFSQATDAVTAAGEAETGVGETWRVRAVWAHRDAAVSADVLISHPLMSLRRALSLLAPGTACYEFVEDIERWRRAVQKHGGRQVFAVHSFFRIVPGDALLHRGDANNDNKEETLWAAALAANNVTSKSAFVRISPTFLERHLDRCVRVVCQEPDMPSAAAALLLPLGEILQQFVRRPGPDMSIVHAAVLYGDGTSPDITVEALRVGETSANAEENEEGTKHGVNGGVNNTAPCCLTPQFIQLEGLTTVDDKSTEATTIDVAALPNVVHFDAAEARSLLRFTMRECALAANAMRAIPLATLCSRWLAGSAAVQNWASASAAGEFDALSIVLPCKRCSTGSALHGRAAAIKQLRAELRAGHFGPVRASAEHKQQLFTVYFEASPNGDENSAKALPMTPMLLLLPRHALDVGTHAETDSDGLARRCRAVLVVPFNRDGNNSENSEGMKSYVAVGLSEEEALRCRENGGELLQSVEVLVDEWVLNASPSIVDVVEREFITPVEHSLRLPPAPLVFNELPEEQQTSLLQSLRQQLQLAITPGKNEALEYLGDAVLDFVAAQEKLAEWSHGPVVKSTSNAVLARQLPEELCEYLSVVYNISGRKQRADVVEALFGAVAMALWVIPRSAAANRAAGLLPFAVVLRAVRALAGALEIALI
ncbi:hypothetical protein DQ04_08151010 [Trypanosoma grayi]|uniref:hypothetical protein n=1 Tax=Trypanosoma grayi TaxID=71804 RepID=UPI0004F4B4F8|nr:hypothetical protein DQ04_08151010 [Trypanosoma grayi]KEG08041.1 hypothetical protein DQ04_08151010 [Trypanosoma grayi]